MDSFDSGAASVYSEAKGEYTKQLTLFIVPAFHRFFMEALEQAAKEEPQVKRQLWKFQELLSQIPEWNMDKVHRETGRIITEINCDYLEELVTAVFIAHTKVLTAIRIGNKNKRVQITIPKLDHFLHRALSESSRMLWSSAYLFHSELSPMDKQKNHRQIEQLLHDGIAQAIRGLLPVKNILKDYLSEPVAGTETEDEDEDDKEDKEDDEKEKEEKGKVKESTETSAVSNVQVASEQVASDSLIPEQVVTDITAVVETVLKETPAVIKFEESMDDDKIPNTNVVQEDTIAQVTPLATMSEVVNTPTSNLLVSNPTLVVDTEPTVRFTDFDQVIQQRGGETHINYIATDRDAAEADSNLNFMDEEGEPLSDFEDLDAAEPEPLDADDFEEI